MSVKTLKRIIKNSNVYQLTYSSNLNKYIVSWHKDVKGEVMECNQLKACNNKEDAMKYWKDNIEKE